VGSDTANLKLSQGRAGAVVAALVGRGVEANRFGGVGFGEMRPIDSDKTDEGRAYSRRVEFIIIDPE
jgi:outer membrane protein OmpA-like peptidoglycan-associated protein